MDSPAFIDSNIRYSQPFITLILQMTADTMMDTSVATHDITLGTHYIALVPAVQTTSDTDQFRHLEFFIFIFAN